jgi:transcriptional regulator GlxA family with amidase domain
MTKFRIYCASSGNVKVAIYDSTGALLNKVDTATVVSGVNTITFPPTSITAGSIYQLAAVSDTLIGLDSGSYHLYKTQTFTGFTFPTTLPSDFKRYDSRVPIFAGYK